MHDAQAPGLHWQTIDLALIDLARRQGALDRELGPWLLLAQREGVHRALGYGCFEEYVERRFGYDPRTAREKVHPGTTHRRPSRVRARARRRGVTPRNGPPNSRVAARTSPREPWVWTMREVASASCASGSSS